MALSSSIAASSQMASLGLRPPQFSEDVAWLPGWFQNLRADGSNEFLRESQILPKEKVKDLTVSQDNVSYGKEVNALSREEGRYNSCHLFLSGDDSSPINFAPSPGNVFHFSLRLSLDVDSLFSPSQGVNSSHNLGARSKLLSIQPIKTSANFGENTHTMMGNGASEQGFLRSSIPKTVNKDDKKSPTDKIDSVRQQKGKAKVTSSADVSNAVELSIAASEALVIHDLVKMESVSESLPTEAVLEVALRVKQARLEGSEDGFLSSIEESDWSDSLSDLNDFTMADAYEDVGLPSGVSNEEHLCSSAMSQKKDVSSAEKYLGCDNKHSDKELTSQLVNLDNDSAKKQLEVNVEIEMQQENDSPVQSLCSEKEKPSDDPGSGHNYHQFVQNTSDDLLLNQEVGSADPTLNRLQNISSLVGSSGKFRKENLANYLVLDRFKSRWLGGWTSEEWDSSPLNQNNAERVPKFFVRETSFLSESADIAPDESSFVQKHDSKCRTGSQPSIPSESLDKPDEGILDSQDMVKCSNLSLDDLLCSVVPCSISSEQANSNTKSDKEINTEKHVPVIDGFDMDNFQRTSDPDVTLDHREEQIMSLPDGEDIPIIVTNTVQQTHEMLTGVDPTCRKQLSSLKTYSMIIPNQSLIEKCNQTLLSTDQRTVIAAPSDKRSSKGLSASKCTDGNKNEQNHEHFDNRNSNIEITCEKRSNNLRAADRGVIPVESSEERRISTLILNDRTPHSLPCPKTVGNDINVEKHPKQHVLPESFAQHQQNNNLNKLQDECNEFHDGHNRGRKQVRFTEAEEQIHLKRTLSKLESSYKKCSSVRAKRRKTSKSSTNYVPHMKHSLTNYCRKVRTKLIFQGAEFLLTGLSSQKERDLEALIRKSGGVVLSDVPSPPNSRGKRSSAVSRRQLPIILCVTKLQTTKFLYGCAVGASILKVDWLTDCIASGTILQPEKYLILPNRNDMKLTIIGKPVRHSYQKPIFERVGIMLHGKYNFCTKLTSIIKHSGAQVFKTLQWLVRSIDEERISVGALVAEDKPCISRHLKYCASERGIPIMPSSWIIKSLYSGKLLPFTEENHTSLLPVANVLEVPDSLEMSEEI